jgi:hypothetical protein
MGMVVVLLPAIQLKAALVTADQVEVVAEMPFQILGQEAVALVKLAVVQKVELVDLA